MKYLPLGTVVTKEVTLKSHGQCTKMSVYLYVIGLEVLDDHQNRYNYKLGDMIPYDSGYQMPSYTELVSGDSNTIKGYTVVGVT